ncbi:unnamed protein product, partial [Schistosoma rodhaini]
MNIYSVKIIIFLLIFQSISMAIAMAIWNLQLDVLYKLAIFGISLVLFTSALLIGAAIKANLIDHLMIILISFLVLSIVIVAIAIALIVWSCK